MLKITAVGATWIGIPLALAGVCANAEAQSADANGQLEEVVVVSNKLGTDLSTAAISATAVTPEEIQRDRLQTIQDVALRSPSLVYSNPSAFAQAYIRGLGSNFSLGGLESAVATYVDGVYLQRQVGAVADLVDLSSAQVLKGPQGTLYGRNATGGVLLLQTADPTNQFEGYVDVEYGRFDYYRTQGVLNVPVSDTFAVRVAAQLKGHDGYLKDIGGGEDRGGLSSDYARIKLRWAPNDAVKVLYGLEHSNFFSKEYSLRASLPAPYCRACQIYGYDPQLADSDFFSSTQSPDTSNRVQFWAHTLTVNWTADNFSLNSVTGYRDQDSPIANEQDHVTPNLFRVFIHEDGPTLTHDTYLRTSFDSPLNYLLGFSLLRERNDQRVSFTGDLVGNVMVDNRNDIEIDSHSIYGEVSYAFDNGFKVTAGARYNKDEKSIDVENGPFTVAFGFAPLAQFSEKESFDSVTPRFVLSYERDGGFYYASYNRGERSGGFGSPILAPSEPVDSEVLDNYEIGAKNTFLGGRLNTTAAVFYGKYKDIQVQLIDSDTGTVLLQNAAEGEVSGIELDFNLQATDSLSVSGGAAFLDNTFKDFPDAAVYMPFSDALYAAGATGLTQGREDLSGERLPNSPRKSGYLALTYALGLGGGWSNETSVLARYTDEYDFSAGAGGFFRNDRQDSYTQVNLSTTFLTPGRNTQVGLFVENLFDEEYYAFAATTGFGAATVAPMPRSYGIRLRQQF